jgi:hypothetical protein
VKKELHKTCERRIRLARAKPRRTVCGLPARPAIVRKTNQAGSEAEHRENLCHRHRRYLRTLGFVVMCPEYGPEARL